MSICKMGYAINEDGTIPERCHVDWDEDFYPTTCKECPFYSSKHSEAYKLYRKHQVEIFDMIYDVYKRAPKQDPISVLFGYDTEEEKEEFDKKMEEYLNLEKPKIIERFKELGFNITLK